MRDFFKKLVFKSVDVLPAADLENLESRIRCLLLQKHMLDHRSAFPILGWQMQFFIWESYFPPWRPSKNDVKNYENAFSGLPKHSKVLVLGATPELRNLAASFGLKPVVADYSLPMLVGMTRFADKVNIDDETWIKSDWLEMPLEGNFDFILGDMVLRQIRGKEQEEKFLGKIKKILSPRGIFVTRLHFINESLFNLSTDEILITSTKISDDNLAVFALVMRFFDKLYGKEENISIDSYKEMIRFMEDAIKKAKNPREKNIFSRALKAMKGGIDWELFHGKIAINYKSKFQLDNLISKFFDIADIQIGGDYPDSEFFPIYFLKPQGQHLLFQKKID